MIDEEELKNFLDNLETTLQRKIDDADRKASENRAPEYYRADMQGFSRGLFQAKNQILDALRKQFLQ